ncbi:MAG: PIN domain-containing protein [Proteobacteria bacterium]|nr:PIN domain-containing protein [Pseudomonadota bacterium]
MIAVDTNILVYAHREDSPWFSAASACLGRLAEGRARWAIPWPCLCEFFAVVTHPRVYQPPTPGDAALEQIDAWLESPTLVVLGESRAHWSELRRLVQSAKLSGSQIHDARIAALCLQHGVRELWSADRDFGRFPQLDCRNPLIP